jgi:rhodanese-related sulfurtransferase
MNADGMDLRHTLAWLALFVAAVFASTPRNHHADVRHVDVAQAKALMDSGALVIDVRERAVSGSSHLPGALLIPLDALAANLTRIEAANASTIVVYCGDGATRGPEAAHILTQAGLIQTVNLKAGIEGWRRAGLPTSGS